jgi:hypothetical protein
MFYPNDRRLLPQQLHCAGIDPPRALRALSLKCGRHDALKFEQAECEFGAIGMALGDAIDLPRTEFE